MAWTTRVSNPVCSPCFRASASICVQSAAFATGVLGDLYAFHRYTPNSTDLSTIQESQFKMPVRGWAPGLNTLLKTPPTLPLRPVIPNNICPPRITAAAGAKLAGASFAGTFKAARSCRLFPADSGLHTEMLHPHMALLRQGFPHCAKFPTAASRRSLGRISVPMCPYTLSGRIPIVALVGRYPANKLMGRKVILKWPKPFEKRRCLLHHYAVLAIRWDSYSPLQGRFFTCYSPVRRSPCGALDLHV